MTFINPIEILALEQTDISLINSTIIKKAKRKVQVEIELAENGVYNYQGVRLTKSDCERAIDELEDYNKKSYYWIIANNKFLNGFLSAGDEKLFSSFKQESIYKDKAFINFISPYYRRGLIKAFFMLIK